MILLQTPNTQSLYRKWGADGCGDGLKLFIGPLRVNKWPTGTL